MGAEVLMSLRWDRHYELSYMSSLFCQANWVKSPDQNVPGVELT